MAPTYVGPCSPFYITQPVAPTTSVSTCNGTTWFSSNYEVQQTKVKKETKKEKRDRISKEKMLSSWKTINKKTMTIDQIKQICKPRHRVGYIGGRNR